MSGGDPIFLTRTQVDRLHDISLERYGGQAGVGDSGLVHSTPSEDELYDAMLAIAKKRLTKAGLAELFRSVAKRKL